MFYNLTNLLLLNSLLLLGTFCVFLQKASITVFADGLLTGHFLADFQC